MDKKTICVDTSVFIDYFRNSAKGDTLLAKLAKEYTIVITAVTNFEIKVGVNKTTEKFWNEVLKNITVLPFGEVESELAVGIFKQLKKENKIIGIQDIFISACCLRNHLPLATLNVKHFERIDKLKIIKIS